MLFLQGRCDALAGLPPVRATVLQPGERATLHVVEGADHSFHVLVRSGRSDAQVLEELAGRMPQAPSWSINCFRGSTACISREGPVAPDAKPARHGVILGPAAARDPMTT